MSFNYVMRGWDAVGGQYVRWESEGAPDFAGDSYVPGTGPAFVDLTDVAVELRTPAASSSGYVAAPYDWAGLPGVITDFGDGSLYPDLSTIDGALACADLPVAAGGKILRVWGNDGEPTLVGRKMAETPTGSWVSAVRLNFIHAKMSFNSLLWAEQLYAFFDGLDIATAAFESFGRVRRDESESGAGIGVVRGTGRTALPITSLQHTRVPSGAGQSGTLDLIFEKDATTTLNMYYGDRNNITAVQTKTVSGGAGILAVMAAANTGDGRPGADVVAFAPPGVLTTVPLLPDES